MALRRQGLSQRRKAVGFTQESLAERLGVERSTVVRWEAGDTEPLPSIRPKVARALQVSVDQLAELLTESGNAGTTRALSADNEVTVPLLLPEVPSEVRPGRTELEDPIHPQVADPVEALRRALRSAGVVPEDLGAMLLVGRSPRVSLGSAEPGRPVAVDADPQAAIALGAVLSALSGLPADIAHPADIDTAGADVGPDTPATTTIGAGGSAGSDVPEPAQTEVPQRPALAAIPLNVEPADVQRRRARSRRFNRLAVMGVLLVLAFAGGVASVPFITSHRGPIPPAAGKTPAPAIPVAAVPAPDSGSGNSPRGGDSTGAVHPVPAAEPNKPADGPATVPASHTIRNAKRTTSRSKPPASTTRPALPRTPAIPAEAYAWSHPAGLSASDQRTPRFRPEALPRP